MRKFFILLIAFTFVSYSDKYPEPIWYEVNFNDGVTHLWSRQVYYDYHGVRSETKEQTTLKYWMLDQQDIKEQSSYYVFMDRIEYRKKKLKEILESI